MENKKEKITIVDEAIADLKKIREAADKNAVERLKKELPEKFEALLKEELNKSKKESVKESVKDVNKEPVIEGKKTDGDKESLNEMEEIDLKELSINDIEEAYDEASNSDEFEISPDDIDISDIEKELGEMEKMNDSMEHMQSESEDSSDPFDQKLKNLHKMLGEMIKDNENVSEMHKGTGEEEVTAMHKGDLTPSVIDEAVDPQIIQSIGGSLALLAASGGLAALMDYLKKNNPKVADTIEKLGSAASGSIKGGTTSMSEAENVNEGEINENVDPAIMDAIMGGMAALATAGGVAPFIKRLMQKYPDVANKIGDAMNSQKNESMVHEEEHDDDHKENEVDEAHGVSYSAGKVRAGSLPNTGAEYRDRDGHSRNRKQWSNESIEKFMTQKETMEKRMNSLISENKKLTKKLNESKVEKNEVAELRENVEKFKKTLVKYRDQLSEMAVFNTNIAGVNSILLDESLALTNEDKKEIVSKFKNVNSITESENTYKSIMSEMKKSKKTLDESVEEKVTNSIDKSSSEKIVEQTAYVNEHLNKIKDMMKYVDNHGNSKILR